MLSWARSSRRSQTPRRAQRRKVWAARDHGPSSAGMARHLAPFSCRQTIADSVRRRSFGCVLPLGRHASTNGSKLIQCASDSIALSSFQEGQNARHHNRFKREQALAVSMVLFIAIAVGRKAMRNLEENWEREVRKYT